MAHTVTRYHDFSAGHRVVGHEGKCRNLHGHNYRVHFTCRADGLDEVGRVVDFSVVKELLCDWLEEHWDHRMLLWECDQAAPMLHVVDDTVVLLPFNPTAENMAEHLVRVVGPAQLRGTGVELVGVVVEETRKCSAAYYL
jgi:6-pyruvoyltetrahydropterin/6-carboxytetrahydropterin synthase